MSERFPDFVPKEEFDRRNSICNQCEHIILDPKKMKMDMCELCGCPIFAKTQLKKNECPIKKWKSWSK